MVQIINSIDFDKIIQTKIDRKKDRSTLRRPVKLQGDLQNSQKNGKGRLIISDLVSDKEIQEASINSEKWCSCIDGALTKENYINCITEAGFKNVEVLKEQLYLSEEQPQSKEKSQVL